MTEDQISLHLGFEHELGLEESLTRVLAAMGATKIDEMWWPVGLKQSFVIGEVTVEVWSEPYEGIDLRGPAHLVNQIQKRVENLRGSG